MKLNIPEIVPSKGDTFKSICLLNREKLADNILHFVKNIDGNAVISIDSKWGDGKTFFIKLWINKYIEEDNICLYIDAFENEFFDDPLNCVISELKIFQEDYWNEKTGNSEKYLDLVFEGMDSCLKKLKPIKAIFNNMTGETLNEEPFSKSSHESYIDHRNAVSEFKTNLQSIIREIKQKTGNPLIIVFDELDRANPIFTINLLEKIKHFFSIEDIIIILVWNRTELEHGIKGFYGSEYNAKVYLDKFIQAEFKLPIEFDNIDNSFDTYFIYSKYLYDAHEYKNANLINDISKSTSILAKYSNLSLRSIKAIVKQITIFRMTYEDFNVQQALLVYLVVLRYTQNVVFDKILSHAYGYHLNIFTSDTNYIDLADIDNEWYQYSKLHKTFHLCFTDSNSREFIKLANTDEEYSSIVSTMNGSNTNANLYLYEVCKRINSFE